MISKCLATLRWAVRNLDSAVTIVLAGVFAVLSLLSVGTIRTVLAGALLVMVLLSIATLRDRNEREISHTLLTALQSTITEVKDLQSSSTIEIAADEGDDVDRLEKLIESLPAIESADLLAFSGRDARGVVEQVLKHSVCPIRLLLKHPDSVGRIQRGWILGELERIQRYVLPEYPDSLDVRCYRASYSLRARKLKPYVINIGWYTPLVDDEVEVVGHTNPLIIAQLDTREGAVLEVMFDRVFESLWSATSTEEASIVMREWRQ